MNSRALILALLLLAPAAAAAQDVAGPYGGLFGRRPERAGREFTALEFRTAVGAQHEDAIGDSGLPAELFPSSATSAGLNAGLAYEHKGDRLRASGQGMATHQQFFRESGFGATSYGAGGLLVAPLAERLSLDASATYQRSPFYHLQPAAYGALPQPAVIVPGDALRARPLTNDTVDATVGLTSPYAKRSTVSGSVSRRATRFLDQPENNFEMWGARGLWTRKLSRDVAARIGYGREEVQQTSFANTRFVHEVLDLGIDLAREFTVSRRTVFNLTTQTSMLRETGGERRYRLNGGIGLTRAFSRTWAASISATRNTEFLPGFLEPVFSDGLSGTISGMFAPRVEWAASLSASNGQVGFDTQDDFVNYIGNSRLTVGIDRRLGLYVDYNYYHYDVPRGSTAFILVPQMSRQTLSVGLSAYVPIFTNVRTPSDPR